MDLIERLGSDKVEHLVIQPDGAIQVDGRKPGLLLPGSFNPLHEGHRRLAWAASELTGRSPAFELSQLNVDKPPLEPAELRRRAAQFEWFAPLWLTRAPLFADKGRLFPDTIFVVGFDTALRLLDPRYYGGSEEFMVQQVGGLAALGCRFLVGGRSDQLGRFWELRDLPAASRFGEMFRPIPRTLFDCPLSSTVLRSVRPRAIKSTP